MLNEWRERETREGRKAIGVLLAGVDFILNTALNTGMMRLLGEAWRESLIGGAMLAQVGEFSFAIFQKLTMTRTG